MGSQNSGISSRILLADDHALFSDALSTYIARAEPGIEIVTVPDLHQARARLDAKEKFDLVMLDWHMPGIVGVNDIRMIVRDYPDTRFVIMSGVIERTQAHQVLEAGVYGYFPKTLSGRLLIDGIRQVLQGKTFVPTLPGAAALTPAYHGEKLFFRPNAEKKQDASDIDAIRATLTNREVQTLVFLANGATNAEIADALGIKDVTVKLHLRNMFEKIGVRNRTEAALKARELGVVADE